MGFRNLKILLTAENDNISKYEPEPQGQPLFL